MSCCVKNCKKSKASDLFHFPVDEKLQKIWVDILKENSAVDPDWELTEYSQICISHFNNSYFIKTDSEIILTGEAYPTIFESDDYLIEEIFEDEATVVENVDVDEVNNMLAYVEEEILPNGNEHLISENIIETEEVLDKSDLDVSKKLKNTSSLKLPKGKGKDDDKMYYTIEDSNSNQQETMFKVVDGKDDDVKVVSKDDTIPAKGAGQIAANKAMQAIQIGNQYYLVSPNTPNGKELTTSQLSAIKEKIMTEMNFKKTVAAPAKSPVKVPLNNKTPMKKLQPKTPVISKVNRSLVNTPGKKVTTIDLNKGLPNALKEIMSGNKQGKKRKVPEEDESETFTVSSSLDIMPVAAKKQRDDLIIGTNRLKSSNFPGPINNANMSNILPKLIINDEEVVPADDEETPVNRTQFYKLLQEVNKNMPALNKTYWGHVYDQNTIVITKTHLDAHKAPRQFLSITVDTKLKVNIFKRASLLTKAELQELNINIDSSISQWQEIKGVIDKLNILPVTDEAIIDFGISHPRITDICVNKTLSVCQKIVDHGRLALQEQDQKIISFLCEQLILLNESKDFRQYSIDLVVFCYILYLTSPTVYQYLKKSLIIPDEAIFKEIGSVDVSRDFINLSESRMTNLATKTNGFSENDKIVVLHIVSTKVNDLTNASHVLIFFISSMCNAYEEIVYLCPLQETIAVNKLVYLTVEIVKKLENINLKVTALMSEYNPITYELYKKLNTKQSEKLLFVPNPVDKRRKLYLLYENLSILTAICWDWMSKELLLFPSLNSSLRVANEKCANKSIFSHIISYIKKQKASNYFKSLNLKSVNLVNQIMNKEIIQVDEKQKAMFALNIFDDALIRAFELSVNREYKQTGEFMRIIFDWWTVVSATSKTDKIKPIKTVRQAISQSNKDPIQKLSAISKWINFWKLSDKKGNRLNDSTFHVLGENCSALKQLSENLLNEYKVDKFFLGTCKINFSNEVGYVTSSCAEQVKFGFK